MTTIALNRKEMACDSRLSWSAEFATVDDKVQRIGDALVGLAGHNSEIQKWLAWFKNKSVVPEFDAEKDFEAVVLTKSGIEIYTSIWPTRITDPFYCTGSGGMAARGAMHCGLTPAEAVAIAIKCDKNSGGKVRSFTL